jgi:excisionase family DNA binding protein
VLAVDHIARGVDQGSGVVSERLLRTRDVAEILDVSCETVLLWHRSGKLPGGRRLGSNVLRFSEPEVEAWIEGTPPRRTLVSVVERS